MKDNLLKQREEINKKIDEKEKEIADRTEKNSILKSCKKDQSDIGTNTRIAVFLRKSNDEPILKLKNKFAVDKNMVSAISRYEKLINDIKKPKNEGTLDIWTKNHILSEQKRKKEEALIHQYNREQMNLNVFYRLIFRKQDI